MEFAKKYYCKECGKVEVDEEGWICAQCQAEIDACEDLLGDIDDIGNK